MSESDEDKEHEPSQKKLDEARRRGEVVRSADLATAAGYGGFLLVCTAAGAVLLQSFGTTAMAMLERAGSTNALPGDLVLAALAAFLPFLVMPGLAALAILLAQRAIVFAPEKLQPRLSRINPVANAAQKFGRTGLFDFAKSTVKLGIVGTLLAVFLNDRMPQILRTQGEESGLVAATLGGLLFDFAILILIISVVIGGADYLWQRYEHLRRNRMSRQEMIDEFKDSEGDPHVKGQRRQRAEAIATNRMLADVPKADVVIVNPTHYAVALRWNRASGRAPVCVAKGVDEIAARIRESAATSGVPVRSDPPTARAIYASVAIGQEIRPDQYAPVAAAIRFAERMRRRARERGGK